MGASELRAEIDRLADAGRFTEAAVALNGLWLQEPTAGSARFLIQRYESWRQSLALRSFRLAVLRSYTVEPLIPLLRAEAFVAGLDLTAHVGEFNVWAQDIYNASSPLYSFEPDAVILALEEPDPSEILGALDFFRRHSAAAVIVHNRAVPARPRRGVFDAQSDASEREAVQALNRRLRETVRDVRGVYVLDYDAVVAAAGAEAWRDARKWVSVRLPMASAQMSRLVGEWMRFVQPLAGKVAKCAVVDLDNTLWGGVIGEDGLDGVKLDDGLPGAFHRELQQALLDLTERGILLAVCSKNNPEEALEALEKHPGMLLRPRHFAAFRINWQEKAQNLEEIAAELNIGVDALAFIDDNPAERQNVRLRLPEATVIELPTDPSGYAAVVRDAPVFQRLQLSEEDSRRGAMYGEQRERKQLEQTCASPEDFLRSLEQEIEIAPLSGMTLARVAQLTQKTNQFNLTTRRYSEAQLEALAAQPGVRVWSLSVRDRFGDNGLTGVAITRQEGHVCEIDTLLLSCRVIGRTVETALLAWLARQAREDGARKLRGLFAPTKKNKPCETFYQDHGFREIERGEAGVLWELDLVADPALEAPSWVQVVAPAPVGD
ncbi:MAG: HAD-IIIC family phosphatase [Acidobacteria bacterium]|nr:HAD-IIIC family phosphatase [Acidobacteriota bacterium]